MVKPVAPLLYEKGDITVAEKIEGNFDYRYSALVVNCITATQQSDRKIASLVETGFFQLAQFIILITVYNVFKITPFSSVSKVLTAFRSINEIS